MPIVQPETLTCLLCLWMGKLIYQFNIFDQVASYASDKLHEVVVAKVRTGNPEGYVAVAFGHFAVGFELCYLTIFELAEEAGVLRPELTDIWDTK